MAWLQNLAGKAEDLLNKIDQNAATVLNETNPNIDGIVVNEKEPPSSHSNDANLPEEYLEKSDVNRRQSSNSSNKSLSSSSSFVVEPDRPAGDTLLETYLASSAFEDLERPIRIPPPPLNNSLNFFEDSQNNQEEISKLQQENADLSRQLLNLQHLYSEVRNENLSLLSQVETSNSLVSAAQSEMEQYKARSQRILQEKEELITLKNQNSSSESSDIFHHYSEELKKELEFQQNKNHELSEKIKKLSQSTMSLQQQIVMLQNSSAQSTEALEQTLAAEKKIRGIAEEECRMKTQELHNKMGELTQLRSVVMTKNEEIAELKQVLNQRPNSGSEGLEGRIKSLTETLMLKQNTLETVTTERNALRIQLEKLENEYQNNLAQLQRAQVRVINVNDTDDVKSQVPQFMRVSPLDAGVTRRVKHAYSTVDAISVRTGIFLRRYPLARVLVFCYMVLLHLWALVILFLYAPSSR